MSDKLSGEGTRAYNQYIADGGKIIYLPPAPMVEEPEWMYDLEEVNGAPILDYVDQQPTAGARLDPARPYEPRYETEQDWRESWR